MVNVSKEWLARLPIAVVLRPIWLLNTFNNKIKKVFSFIILWDRKAIKPKVNKNLKRGGMLSISYQSTSNLFLVTEQLQNGMLTFTLKKKW